MLAANNNQFYTLYTKKVSYSQYISIFASSVRIECFLPLKIAKYHKMQLLCGYFMFTYKTSYSIITIELI
jgi:hypothetical protein